MKAAVNPYQQYKNNQVDTADPKQLIIMLYDGAIRFLETASARISDFHHYSEVNEKILKAQDIITELMLALNMDEGGEIAGNLFNLYAYMKKELIEGNIKKNKAHIDSVVTLLKELKVAWEKVDPSTQDKASPTNATAPQQSPQHPDGDYKPFIAQG